MISSGNVTPFPFRRARKSNEIDGILGGFSEIGEIRKDFSDFDAIPALTIYRACTPLWLEAPGRGISWNSERFCTDSAEFRGGGRKGPWYPLRVTAPDRELTKIRENPLIFGEFTRFSHFHSVHLP